MRNLLQLLIMMHNSIIRRHTSACPMVYTYQAPKYEYPIEEPWEPGYQGQEVEYID